MISTERYCPEIVESKGYERVCGLPVLILDSVTFSSTDGPVEHVHTRCFGNHHLFLPLERLLTQDSEETT